MLGATFRKSADQRQDNAISGDPNLTRSSSKQRSGTHSRTRGICGFRAHGLVQSFSCRWSKICLGYSREGRKETADYLFITLIVPSFTFPSGYTACLNHAHGWEILMLETGSGCLHCRPRRGKIDSRAASPKPRSGALGHDGSLDLASVLGQNDPPTPRSSHGRKSEETLYFQRTIFN